MIYQRFSHDLPKIWCLHFKTYPKFTQDLPKIYLKSMLELSNVHGKETPQFISLQVCSKFMAVMGQMDNTSHPSQFLFFPISIPAQDNTPFGLNGFYLDDGPSLTDLNSFFSSSSRRQRPTTTPPPVLGKFSALTGRIKTYFHLSVNFLDSKITMQQLLG